MNTDPLLPSLSRREREILDILYRLGHATAAEVRAELADSPSDSTVRTLLRLLEEKGHVAHAQDGPRFVYQAATPPTVARRGAVRHLLATFFGGRPQELVAALLEDEPVDPEVLESLAQLVEAHRRTPPGGR